MSPAPLDRSTLQGLRLRLLAEPAHFKRYREAAADFLRASLLTREAAEDMILALDEAMGNIVRHSQRLTPRARFVLELVTETFSDGPHQLVSAALVEHGEGGRGFSPVKGLSEALAAAAAGEPHGLGLMLIYQIMDHVGYVEGPDGENRLLLQKHILPGPHEPRYLPTLIAELQRSARLDQHVVEADDVADAAQRQPGRLRLQ